MNKRRYTYISIWGDGVADGGEYRILDMGTKGYCNPDDPVVWSMPYEEGSGGAPPAALREKYEELNGIPEFVDVPTDRVPLANVVEVIAGREDSAWDQPCRFGYRVESHAVYCHNEGWLYAPGKCRWGQWDAPPHEECRGFQAPEPVESHATTADGQ